MWFKRKSDEAELTADMRALVIVESELHVKRIARPTLGKGEALIRVAYAGVNRADLLQVQGSYSAPEGASEIVGLEVSGVIEELGEGVIGWSVGEKVCALTNGGGYAEYVVVPASHLLALPVNISLQEAASLPEACATATMTLMDEAHTRYGERVLLHGGASGIGVIMIQVARAIGAKVYATASSQAKQDLIASLGATPLSYDHEQFAEKTKLIMGGHADVIVDTIGGSYFQQHLKLLGRGGRMVSIAFLEGALAPVSLGPLLMKHLRWSGVTLRGKTAPEKAAIMESVRKQLWPLVAAGHIKPVVDSVFTMEKASEAHIHMDNRLNRGKIVLEVAPAL